MLRTIYILGMIQEDGKPERRHPPLLSATQDCRGIFNGGASFYFLAIAPGPASTHTLLVGNVRPSLKPAVFAGRFPLHEASFRIPLARPGLRAQCKALMFMPGTWNHCNILMIWGLQLSALPDDYTGICPIFPSASTFSLSAKRIAEIGIYLVLALGFHHTRGRAVGRGGDAHTRTYCPPP